MKRTLHKTAVLLLSGVVSLSLFAGCAGTPAASSDAPVSPPPASASSQPQTAPSSEAASEPASASSEASQAQPSSEEASKTEGEGKVMVVYYSATGNTKSVAEVIAAATDGELYEIVPELPYTSADLDWTKADSRSTKEHEDPAIRPAIAGGVKDLSGYDTIFIGYPLWWGEAPNIVWNFVESSDLKGKTVIPFATSASSAFGSSGKTLEGMAPDANWQDGQRFRSGAPEADVQSWVSGLNL